MNHSLDPAMIEDLDQALHGVTWERPNDTPEQVWSKLLGEVRDLIRENKSLRAISGRAGIG